MFGRVLEKSQSERTPFNPQSPYAIAKVFGHYVTQNYRKSYNMYAVSGILFNHESPFRGEEFVTRKITHGLVAILNKDQKFVELGNLDSKRDWGYAKDYVEPIWKMMQKKKPEDYVISTGKTYSVRDFINVCTKFLKWKTKWTGKGINEKLINLENNKILVKINKNFYRPAEVNFLKGNSSKARKLLKWSPKTNLKKLVRIMMSDELKFYIKMPNNKKINSL